MKDEEFKDISLEDMMRKLIENKSKIIEEFTRAFLAESELKPSEVEFVTQQMPMVKGIIEHRYFFRKKT